MSNSRKPGGADKATESRFKDSSNCRATVSSSTSNGSRGYCRRTDASSSVALATSPLPQGPGDSLDVDLQSLIGGSSLCLRQAGLHPRQAIALLRHCIDEPGIPLQITVFYWIYEFHSSFRIAENAGLQQPVAHIEIGHALPIKRQIFDFYQRVCLGIQIGIGLSFQCLVELIQSDSPLAIPDRVQSFSINKSYHAL